MPASSHETHAGALLWATSASSDSRQLIEAVARDFGLQARFCNRSDVVDLAKTGQWELLGVELDAPLGESLALLRELRRRCPHLTLVVACADSSVPTIRAVLEAGARDFLSLPLEAPEVHKVFIKATQASLKRDRSNAAVGEIITIHGVRGGLGATTLAVNLAVRLA